MFSGSLENNDFVSKCIEFSGENCMFPTKLEVFSNKNISN